MNETVTLEKIKQICEEEDGRYFLHCHKAFEIAKELKLKISEIGKICNSNNIKITSCQLGCFK